MHVTCSKIIINYYTSLKDYFHLDCFLVKHLISSLHGTVEPGPVESRSTINRRTVIIVGYWSA